MKFAIFLSDSSSDRTNVIEPINLSSSDNNSQVEADNNGEKNKPLRSVMRLNKVNRRKTSSSVVRYHIISFNMI